MKYLLLFPLLFAAALSAQSTDVLSSRSVSHFAGWVFYYNVDHGSTAQAVTIDADFDTQSASGLRVRILDVDNKSVNGFNDEANDLQNGPGMCNAQLVTQVRSGVHPVIIIVQTATTGTTVFDGQIACDVGSMAAGGAMQSFRVQDGLFMPFGLYAAFNGVFSTTANYTTNIVVDFGAASQSITFNFEGIGSALNEIRIYDVTGGDNLIETLVAAPTGNMSTSSLVTTASHSGEVEFRIEVEGDGTAGDVFWAVWIPSTVEVVSASGDGVPSSGGGGGGGGGGGCVSDTNSGYILLTLSTLLMATALARRLRDRRRS